MSTSPTFIFDSLTRCDVTDFCLAPGVFACCFLTCWLQYEVVWRAPPSEYRPRARFVGFVRRVVGVPAVWQTWVLL